MNWSVGLFDSTGTAITGATALTTLRIRRIADNYFLDWSDNTFKSTGWSTIAQTATEVSSANYPGVYYWTTTETAWTNGEYEGLIRYAGATPLNGLLSTRVYNGSSVDLATATYSATIEAKTSKLNFSVSNDVLATLDSETVRLDATSVDLIWDETLTGATHNIPTSAGRRLRQVTADLIHDGLAVGAGSNGNQIQLDALASTINGAYDPALIAIVNGTGAGQCRLILQYDGTTQTATVDRTWKVNPANDSEFVIWAHPGREHVNEGLIRSAGSNWAQLNVNASSAEDEYIG